MTRFVYVHFILSSTQLCLELNFLSTCSTWGTDILGFVLEASTVWKLTVSSVQPKPWKYRKCFDRKFTRQCTNRDSTLVYNKCEWLFPSKIKNRLSVISNSDWTSWMLISDVILWGFLLNGFVDKNGADSEDLSCIHTGRQCWCF